MIRLDNPDKSNTFWPTTKPKKKHLSVIAKRSNSYSGSLTIAMIAALHLPQVNDEKNPKSQCNRKVKVSVIKMDARRPATVNESVAVIEVRFKKKSSQHFCENR